MGEALEGLKILDLSWIAAGPVATKILGDLGATIVKIESLEHYDVHRAYPPYACGIAGANRSGAYAEFNSSKYSMGLNLVHPKARKVTEGLISWADVVIENFRPGVMEELNLGYDELNKINPEIIMVRVTAYGQRPPYSSIPGLGFVLQALVGVSNVVGWPDRGPTGPSISYTDPITGFFVAIAILSAMEYKKRTGKGVYIDLSQLQAMPYIFSPSILDCAANERVTQPLGNRDPRAAPHGAFRCKGDDRWCTIAIFSDEEWEALCQVFGDTFEIRYTKFATFVGRKENEDELERLIESWTTQYAPEEVMERLQAVGVRAGVVREAKDLIEEDPQLRERNYFHYLNHPEIGYHANKSAPFILSKSSRKPQSPAPCIGEHNEYVCREILNMSDEEFIELISEGVIH